MNSPNSSPPLPPSFTPISLEALESVARASREARWQASLSDSPAACPLALTGWHKDTGAERSEVREKREATDAP